VIAQGGKQVYGAPIGILMLEARFPRIPGDMGNALTWPFPVLYHVVPGASPDLVVRRHAEGMLEPFIQAGRALIRQGAEAITTNCGFLALSQAELSEALAVPVATSSLMQVPMVQTLLPPGRRVGVLTVSAASLTAEHLAKAGCPADTPVVGTEGGTEFSRVLLENEPALDIEAARADLVAAGRQMVERHREVGAIVLECTNMPPYARDVREATGLPVFSMVDHVCWLHAGLRPRRWPDE
jgi:Asp/Glu/hydantoin racemase